MKIMILATAVLLVASATVSATGGGGGAYRGSIPMDNELRAEHWNGQPGKQIAAINGVRIQWFADACGTPNGKQFNAEQCAGEMGVDVKQERTSDATNSTGFRY